MAPFVKRVALRRLLDAVPTGARVRCVTRWRLEDVLAGVSDLDVWTLLTERSGSLALLPHLHAKYYRFDDVAFVGSANITATALDWRSQANLELLIEMLPTAELLAFEAAVQRQATSVDAAMYQHMQVLVDALRPQETTLGRVPEVEKGKNINAKKEGTELAFGEKDAVGLWLPKSRTPQALYEFYRGADDLLTLGAREAAALDLAAFPLPLGLEEKAFNTYVGWYLIQTPVVRRIDAFVAEPQRFGAVRTLLQRMEDYPDRRDTARDWQSLMRWLLYFLPGHYQAWEAKYSEIFVRVTNCIFR